MYLKHIAFNLQDYAATNSVRNSIDQRVNGRGFKHPTKAMRREDDTQGNATIDNRLCVSNPLQSHDDGTDISRYPPSPKVAKPEEPTQSCPSENPPDSRSLIFTVINPYFVPLYPKFPWYITLYA
ncbi:uncharacterized protein CLUP02_08837 [Colletotrichum lupini]|uniref:Uncharacterized protein n=1 Tax=Colletotrichum lupini TaxID=145971 RepID=A0A9Q8SVF9_9PEZI|nr:uncharacterized protein CLUP02_08837 [Colletotrichum lupini]UQC83342.1 hypothetical protein CLUP02_08837 [Colletotrichum lupini]